MWSPIIDPQTGQQQLAAVRNHDTLLLVNGLGQTIVLENDVDPVFSWSPDGRWLAYVKHNSLFILPINGGQAKKIADKVFYQHGWIGDHPIWAFEHQALIYAEAPFKIALMDGTQAFTPLTVDGKIPEGGRALNLLWSDKHLRLVIDTEDYDGNPLVWVYKLSEDLRTVVDSYSISGARLAAWWVQGESVLLTNGRIIFLTENAPILR